MRIGIDIDDTICNTRESINNKLKELNMSYEIFHNLPYEKREELFYNNALNILSSAKILNKSKEVIDYLKDRGHTIYVITARNNEYDDEIIDMTKEYLKNNEIYYDEIIFDARTKGEACLKNEIDIMIDDNFDNCMCVKNVGIKALYYNNDNVNTDELECVYNWDNIYEYFMEE